MRIRKALCLDLDGTVRRNKEHKNSHINHPDEIELMPGIEEIIYKYRGEDYLVLGVTNQAGIAHGFKTVEGCQEEIERTRAIFKMDPFHDVVFCPFDAKGSVFPYNVRSLCRKPGYGMLAQLEMRMATRGYIIDWDNSLFVGDRPEDEGCANAAGVRFEHIDTFLNKKHFENNENNTVSNEER